MTVLCVQFILCDHVCSGKKHVVRRVHRTSTRNRSRECAFRCIYRSFPSECVSTPDSHTKNFVIQHGSDEQIIGYCNRLLEFYIIHIAGVWTALLCSGAHVFVHCHIQKHPCHHTCNDDHRCHDECCDDFIMVLEFPSQCIVR